MPKANRFALIGIYTKDWFPFVRYNFEELIIVSLTKNFFYYIIEGSKLLFLDLYPIVNIKLIRKLSIEKSFIGNPKSIQNGNKEISDILVRQCIITLNAYIFYNINFQFEILHKGNLKWIKAPRRLHILVYLLGMEQKKMLQLHEIYIYTWYIGSSTT